MDLLLASLTGAVETGSLHGPPLTLTLSGMLVSGIVIPSATYMERVSQLLASISGDETAEIGLLGLAALADDPEVDLWRGAIHLADAAIATNGRVLRVSVWRGQLAAVAGWAIGQCSTAA